MKPGQRAAIGAGLSACVVLLGGCTLEIGRGPVADFLVKDYDLPGYREDQAAFAVERQRVEPDESTGALGGVVGAFAGGRWRAWRASASGSVGGLAGSLVGSAFSDTEHRRPLPRGYEGLALVLPVVVTDPNKGITVGMLPAVVLQEGERITNIFAPDLTYNEIDGLGGVFRMLRYFSNDSQLLIDAGTSTEGYNQYKARYEQRRIGPSRLLTFQSELRYDTDLSRRFYGLGNETEDSAESSYVFRQTTAGATLGLQLPLHLSAELTERVVSYKVGPGRLEDVPSTKAAFRDVYGVSDGRLTILTHQIRLTFDGRDSRSVPTQGVFGQFTYDVGDDSLGSDVGFNRFTLELIAHIPKLRKRLITVLRVKGWIMTGDEIPFYELTPLGGRSTIRGYGEGRFVERNAYVANLEERFQVLDFLLFDYRLQLQVAGFVDVGRVYEEGEAFTLRHSKVAVGGAIRVIVPDSDLVTSFDMGFSDEGSAIFVNLDYPF